MSVANYEHLSPRTHTVLCMQCDHQRCAEPFRGHGDISVQGGQWWKQRPEVCYHKGEVVNGVWPNQKSLCLMEAVSTAHKDVLLVATAKKRNVGLEKLSVVLLSFLVFFNPSPLVLLWRSYDEARSISEQRMKWKSILTLHISLLSFNMFSSSL